LLLFFELLLFVFFSSLFFVGVGGVFGFLRHNKLLLRVGAATAYAH